MPGLKFDIGCNNAEFLDKFKQMEQEVKVAQERISKLEGTMSQTSQVISSEGENMTNAFKKIGVAMGAYFSGQQLLNFSQSIVKVRSQIESLEVSFKTLLGSEEKATNLLTDIRQFAVSTPMQLGDLASGAQTMLGFGIDSEKIMPLLKEIGDVAQGDSQKFQSLTLAFSQATSTGKLMGQDLLQLINAGFNPLNEMAKTTGKTIAELKDDMSKGQISAEMLADAFKSATSEGGMFYNALADQSQTINGSISNLQGAWDDMLNSIGEKYQETFVDAVNGTTDIIKHYENYVGVLGGLVAAYGTYKAVLMATVVIEKSKAIADNIQLMMMFRKELGLVTAAQQAFNIAADANPYVLLASAIAVVVGALSAYYLAADHTSESQRKLNEETEETKTATEKEKEAVEELTAIVKDANKTDVERQEALEKLKQIETSHLGNVKKVFQAYATYKDYVNDATNAQKAFNEEIDRTNRLQGQADYKSTQSLLDRLKEYKQAARAISDATDAYHKTVAQQKESAIYNLLPEEVQKLIRDDGIDEVIRVYTQRAKNAAGQARLAAQAEWMNKWTGEGVDAKALEKELNTMQQYLDSAVGKNKKYAVINGIPISQDDLRARINAGNKILEESKKTTEKNYKYWEDIKKKAEDDLKALGSNKEGTAQWNRLTQKIKEAEAQMAKYSVSKSSKDESDAAKLAKQKQQYIDAEKALNKKVIRAQEDAELERRQAEIDILDEGFDKTKKQIDLNYDKEKKNIERWYEDLIQTRRDEEKALWEKNPANAKKTWSDSYSTASYTEEDKAEYKAKTEANEKVRTDAIRDSYQQERQYMIDYLKEYGTIEEQKLAIVEEYEQKILKAKSEYEKLSLQNERDAIIKGLDFDQFKDQINWEGIFGNLENVTKNRLNDLRQQLVDFMNSDEFKGSADVENKKELMDALNSIDEAVDSRRGAISSYIQNRKDVEIAAKELNKAREDYEQALMSQNTMQSLFERGWTSLQSLNEAKQNTKDKKETKDQAENNYTNTAAKTEGKLVDALSELNANIQALPELMSTLGIDENSTLGRAVKGMANMANNAMGAYEDFKNKNYVGALTKGINAIDDAIGIFDAGNMEEMNEEIERLSKANEGLTAAVNDLTESLQSGSVSGATSTYEKTLELLQKQEENSSRVMQDEARIWSHGSHSIGAQLGDSGSFSELLQKVNEILGTNVQTANDFLSLSASQMKELRDSDTDTYNNILQAFRDVENEHTGSGIDEMIEQYISNFADAYDDLNDTLREKLTDTSFDSIQSDFKSTLLDMTSDVEDFTEDFESMMRNAVVNAMVSDVFEKRLRTWYNSFSDSMQDGELGTSELALLQDQYDAIVSEAITTRDALLNVLGLDSDASSSSTGKSVSSMSQETADELNGRFTAFQLSNEGINQQMSVAVANLQSILSLKTEDSRMLGEMQNLMILQNGYLEDIANYTKELQGHTAQLAQIVTNTNNI